MPYFLAIQAGLLQVRNPCSISSRLGWEQIVQWYSCRPWLTAEVFPFRFRFVSVRLAVSMFPRKDVFRAHLWSPSCSLAQDPNAEHMIDLWYTSWYTIASLTTHFR